MTISQRRRVRLEVEVVAMGASTGGLHAFQAILSELPAEFPAAILLVQHRMAEVESRLVELLARHSNVPVIEPDDKERLLAGHAYLAPAGYHMLVERGSISLSTDAPVWFARPSIDVLFESVAESYGVQAVGVVLTGANQDGAAGAHSIQSSGGRVLVEEPRSAVSPELPRAALERFQPDAVVPLPRIAPTLIEWCCRATTSKAARTQRS